MVHFHFLNDNYGIFVMISVGWFLCGFVDELMGKFLRHLFDQLLSHYWTHGDCGYISI